MNIPEPLKWTGDSLAILDQRALPGKEIYINARTYEDVVSAIRNMAVRGAPLIGIVAAYGLALAFIRDEDIESAKNSILGARPTAINPAKAIERVLRADDPVAEAIAIHQEEKERCLMMAEHGARLIKEGSSILTHCNTGVLATGGIGTALGVIYKAYEQGKIRTVWATETRPWLQGARLTCWELGKTGIPHTLIVDGMAAFLISCARVDAVLVGADRIAANGDVANKIGTLSLAVSAKHFGIPFYVVAPSTSFDPKTIDGKSIEIEERPEGEVLSLDGIRMAPESTHALNYAFDITPARLITAYITEEGIRET
ncbi:MAG: S-methyl-5-thioribose-1-phosphate isomerase [candidate division WOR-3 bacterium]